jgi:hypothetical protein
MAGEMICVADIGPFERLFSRVARSYAWWGPAANVFSVETVRTVGKARGGFLCSYRPGTGKQSHKCTWGCR